MIDLKPVTVLRGVGDSLATRLRALGVETTQDLLFLLPLRYEDRTRIVPLGELRPGQRASVEGEVLLTEVAFRGRRQMLCRIGDGSGFLTFQIFLFHRPAAAGPGARCRVRCFGEARRGAKGLEFVHPEYRRVDPKSPQPPDEHLTPIYPMTEGVTQGRLRLLVKLALDQTSAQDPMDWLPPALLADSHLPSLRDALLYVHRPPTDAPVELLMSYRHPAQRRLVAPKSPVRSLEDTTLPRARPLDSYVEFRAGDRVPGRIVQLVDADLATAVPTHLVIELAGDLGLPRFLRGPGSVSFPTGYGGS